MDELTPEQYPQLEELYGSFTEEQFIAHIAVLRMAADREALTLFEVSAEYVRRFGLAPAVDPVILDVWRRLGVDLRRVGLVAPGTTGDGSGHV